MLDEAQRLISPLKRGSMAPENLPSSCLAEHQFDSQFCLEEDRSTQVSRQLHQAKSWTTVLPEIGLWSSQHPDQRALISFLVDARVALAKLNGPAEALKLLASQPPEVKLSVMGSKLTPTKITSTTSPRNGLLRLWNFSSD